MPYQKNIYKMTKLFIDTDIIVDFLIDRETDKVYLTEINTIPGFTKISMYPKLWEATGLPYKALIEKLIDLALERKAQRDHTEREFRS